MPCLLLVLLIFGLLTTNARALPDMRTLQSPGEQCRAAILAAERGHGIPPQLLSAIGRVESGRRDPGTGAWGAWPWTINAEGQGAYFETKAEATRAVATLQARGVRSIDVGCMQVNLMHHPNAFPNLDMAFEPMVNADYAARFLNQLHDQSGDWTRAAANYHSANPWEGDPYAAKVLAVWPEEQRKAGQMPPPVPFAAPIRGMPFPRFAARLPVRPPPPMYPLAGTAPGMAPSRMVPSPGTLPPIGMIATGFTRATTPQNEMPMPRLMPPGMMVAGTMPIGRLMSPGMMQAGSVPSGPAYGRDVNIPGRGLDFYRAVPFRAALPVRAIMPRFPYQLSFR